MGELGAVNATRRAPLAATWQDFSKDCSLKTSLGNPIHVTTSFAKKYRNNTIKWEGSLLRKEDGLHLLWIRQRSALFVRMSPSQFPKRESMADVVLTYEVPSK